MSDYSAFERLLGLPPGSTAQGEDELKPLLTTGIKTKTTELVKKLDQIEVLSDMPQAELVKRGFDLEVLEQDKVRIRTEAFEVYAIAKSLLTGFKEQIDRSVNPNDRMWLAGAKLVDSLTGSLDKLLNMTIKFRQEEELKGLTLVGKEEEKATKTMSAKDWLEFVKSVKEDDSIK